MIKCPNCHSTNYKLYEGCRDCFIVCPYIEFEEPLIPFRKNNESPLYLTKLYHLNDIIAQTESKNHLIFSNEFRDHLNIYFRDFITYFYETRKKHHRKNFINYKQTIQRFSSDQGYPEYAKYFRSLKTNKSRRNTNKIIKEFNWWLYPQLINSKDGDLNVSEM